MTVDSIGTKSSISYTDVVKPVVSREPKAAAQAPQRQTQQVPQRQEAPSEPTKKTSVFAGAEQREPETSREEENVSRKMKSAIDQVNQKMRPTKAKCEFSYHEDTKRVSIKVIDEDTDEVIREIPPEETLEMLTKMWELAGLLVDESR